MRMWGINPKLLCNKHLLGEHVEMHMFIGTIKKGISIQGYLNKKLVDPSKIVNRHDALMKEMIKRGMNHQSPLVFTSHLKHAPLDLIGNTKELKRRCSKCLKPIV